MKFEDKNLIFITGQSKLSSGDAISSMYAIFSLALVIDIRTDIIVDVSCTTAMELTNNFIREIIINKNLVGDIDEIIEEVRLRFFGLSQKPLMAALKDVQNRYLNQLKIVNQN